MLSRLARHGVTDRVVLAPHEPVAPEPWKVALPRLRNGEKLRIALIGVLAQQKGAAIAAAVAEAADPALLEIHLIGYPEHTLPEPAERAIICTGEYEDADLPRLLAKLEPHLVWFPAQWPETYSYTLSAAIEAGLPIVAASIGAFPERLRSRPLTWLVEPAASTQTWLETFSTIRRALLAGAAPPAQPREPQPDFYADDYLRVEPARTRHGFSRPGRTSVVVIPERFDSGPLTPCAYIRLLQPLDHLAAAAGLDLVVADAEEALHYRPDVIVTQRYAVQGEEAGEALLRHCRQHGITLLYDLDDDLLHIPREHPDGRLLRKHRRDVERMLRGASIVWVSTEGLRQRLAALRPDARVVGNGLDERLWGQAQTDRIHRVPTRILLMGTTTHDADFAIVEPALARLHDTFGGRVGIDLIGFSSRTTLPGWINRISPPVGATLSYPGFVDWITHGSRAGMGWDIGLAPLADTPFNRCKSSIKLMDYAALGLAIVASDGAVYRATLEGAGLLVPNSAVAWFDALAGLIRTPRRRRDLAEQARAIGWRLAAQTERRLAAWRELCCPALSTRTQGPVPKARSPARRQAVGAVAIAGPG